MERQGCGPGCIVAGLGLVLSCCLFPYLISSIYSIISSLLQISTGSTWLWGDWIDTIVGSDTPMYMVLAEGPICCVGVIALLIVILGVVMMINGLGPGEEYYDVEEYDLYEE